MSNAARAEKPTISVVLASQNAVGSVAECLREIGNQARSHAIEILVVDNSSDGTQDIIARDFPHVKLFRAPMDKLIPELWGIGFNLSVGDLIAVSTTHFVPSENWIAEIVKGHDSDCSGIGGAIENDEHSGLVSWAVYFCRYSRYMLPFARQNTHDFAADNASYKRSELDRVKHAMGNGFWEVFVHREMQKERMSLILTPEIVVRHQNSFTFSGFISQRFWHGRQFGSTRAASIAGSKRVALVLLSPLIPFVYLFRITGRVFARKRNINNYVMSLPILIPFLTSWSFGEFIGYLRKSESAETRK